MEENLGHLPKNTFGSGINFARLIQTVLMQKVPMSTIVDEERRGREVDCRGKEERVREEEEEK